MFFGLIDTSRQARERRDTERALRRLRRSIRRDSDGVPYVAGAYVVRDAETRPRPVVPRSREEAGLPPIEPTDEDREMVRMFLEIKRRGRCDSTTTRDADELTRSNLRGVPRSRYKAPDQLIFG